MKENIYYTQKTVVSLIEKLEKLKSEVSFSTTPPTIVHRSNSMEMDHNSVNNGDSGHSERCGTSKTTSEVNISESSSTTGSGKEKRQKRLTIEDLSAEVGSMTITQSNEVNLGSLPSFFGSQFTKLFLRQLSLGKLGEMICSQNEFENFDMNISQRYATLPPYRITRFAVLKYINYIHVLYPILVLQDLKLTVLKMYSSPRQVTLNEKFTLFLVISIGLDRGEKDEELSSYAKQFKPLDYFNTAYRYLEEIISQRSEKSLQALLLVIIWILNTTIIQTNFEDLWHLVRFSMSFAMELGVHRYNPAWNFGAVKNELRNRLFWCTYILDREIAIKFSRSLSLRKQAIDTPLPKLIEEDYIIDDSFATSDDLKIYDKIQFRPAMLLISISEIYGDILENIYVKRSRGEGQMTEQEFISYKGKLESSLNEWMGQVKDQFNSDLACFHQLRVKYCIASVLMNRPSPSIPKPTIESVVTCKNSSIACIDSYTWLIEHGYKVKSTSADHIMISSLSLAYSCWKTESNSNVLKDYSMKIINIIDFILEYYPAFAKFKNLFTILSSVVIDGFDNLENTKKSSAERIEYLKHHIPLQVRRIITGIQYPTMNSFSRENFTEFNDRFTDELFDVFKQNTPNSKEFEFVSEMFST